MYALKTKLHERQKKYKVGDLQTLVLDVTNKCNMHCKFCYADTFCHKEPVELDVLKHALDEAHDMGVFHYTLMGGEPFADYERLKKIIPMLYPDETFINIVSNGWMLTREKIEELKNLQVDKIAFSLDSGIEAEHDENRMSGSYQRVLKAIDMVKDAGLLAAVSTVVTHQNLYSEGFNKVYEIAKDKGIRFEVQIAEPVGKWDGNRDCLITKEDAEYIYQMYKNSSIMDNGQVMVKRDLYRGHSDQGGKVCCPAGTEFMAITVDGNFMPCNFIQATLGNIKDKSLSKMRDDLLKSRWFCEEYPHCILGEDEKYIDDIVMKYKDYEKPLDAYKVFDL